jgi:hypothetical protein
MENQKKISIFSKINVEYGVEADDRGFAVNCNLSCDSDPEWGFDDTTIPAYLILVTKSLCSEMGLDFHTLISNTMMAEEKSKWIYTTKTGSA